MIYLAIVGYLIVGHFVCALYRHEWVRLHQVKWTSVKYDAGPGTKCSYLLWPITLAVLLFDHKVQLGFTFDLPADIKARQQQIISR